MALMFYPQSDDTHKGTLEDRLDVLMSAAERYKAVILDLSSTAAKNNEGGEKKPTVPREQAAAYNWDEIARALREIRELPEGNREGKLKKSRLLTKLAEVYEVLRAAKMSKLEAVRLALISEANQLRGDASQVA
ncbi:MAG: hypothetical protein EPO11_08505 [Gammaproteobacteria bacterium]|nr:MAG: hypothetical protein EPO11_08505 [Gammaproteobacteria bacterium]